MMGSISDPVLCHAHGPVLTTRQMPARTLDSGQARGRGWFGPLAGLEDGFGGGTSLGRHTEDQACRF